MPRLMEGPVTLTGILTRMDLIQIPTFRFPHTIRLTESMVQSVADSLNEEVVVEAIAYLHPTTREFVTFKMVTSIRPVGCLFTQKM